MLKSFPSFSIFTLFLLLSNSFNVFGQKPLRKPPRPVRSTPAPSRPQRSPRLTVTGTLDGHSYVDLGLSVKWATCNVGANSPEEYGDYFAWGETAPKNNYTSENCKSYGVKLSDISGNVQYDAARSNWGGSWCLPTKEEFLELVNNCTSTWTTYKGVKGRLVKSNINGNCIFLPAAGGRYFTFLSNVGHSGYYWSASPVMYDYKDAYNLYLNSGNFDWNICNDCYYELSVRPVHKAKKDSLRIPKVKQLTVSGTVDNYYYVDLGLSVKWATCNVGASAPEEYGDYFAWGETAPKSNYTVKNSKYFGVKLNDISGNVQYDAARSNWGGGWRSPTTEEFDELVSNCIFTWAIYNSVKGYLVKNKKNGNCIFLPAAGFRHGTSLHSVGNDGCYLSASGGFILEFSSFDSYRISHFLFKHFDGNSVRPVHD